MSDQVTPALATTTKTQDSQGNALNSSGPGFLRVTDEPQQLFYDPFDGNTVDVTDRWTAGFGLGAAVTPSQATGQLTVNAGATSTGWSSLGSKPTFAPTVPSWLGCSFALNLTDGAALVASGYRFWGQATIPVTPSVAAPITDGYGFEVNGGKMYAVVWNAGVRTIIQDLSAATGNATAPTDANNHRYIVQIRTDRTYWYIDALTTPVATSNFQSPAVQTLPARYLAVSGGAATTIQSPGVAVWDTGKNATAISDGAMPFRKATVKDGVVAVTADKGVVVTLHPSSAPTATQPVSGTVTSNQGSANATPWNENIAQIGGVAYALRPVPTGGVGLASLPVHTNAQQAATYKFVMNAVSSGALVANTRKDIISIEHAAATTKTTKVRRIILGVLATSAVAGDVEIRIFRGTAASSAGTALTAMPTNPATAAPGANDVVVKTIPTITAATGPVWAYLLGTVPATANSAIPSVIVYDWQEAGETQPLTLRSGVLDSLVIAVQSIAAITVTVFATVTVTEE